MIEKELKLRVNKKRISSKFLLPETMAEAMQILPEREILRAIEERVKYLAKLNLLRSGRPAREKRKLIIDLTKLDPSLKEKLVKLGLA